MLTSRTVKSCKRVFRITVGKSLNIRCMNPHVTFAARPTRSASVFLFVPPSQLLPRTPIQVYAPDLDIVVRRQGRWVLRQKYQLHPPPRSARYRAGQQSHRLLPEQSCLLQKECYHSQGERESEPKNHARSISREKDELPGCNVRHSKQRQSDHCLPTGI